VLKHSSDRGQHWLRNAKLFDEAGVNPVNWCTGLSFLNSRDGWALGWGSLWSTSDGGEHWSKLSLPKLSGDRHNRFEHIARLDKLNAFLSTSAGNAWATHDGGLTWSEQPTAAGARVTVTRANDGRPVLTVGDSAARGQPILVAARDNDRVDSAPALSDDVMTLLDHAGAFPLLTPATNAHLTLTLLSESKGIRWGAAKRSVFRTDANGTWYSVDELPNEAEQIAATEMGDLIVRTSKGLLRGLGHGWQTASAADQADWERLTSGTSSVQREFECLERGNGWIAIEWSFAGCFGGTSNSTRIELMKSYAKIASSGVPLSAGRDAVARIRDAIEKPEEPSDCTSTTGQSATVKWQCDGQAAHELSFTTHACGNETSAVTGGETRFFGGSRRGYSRAIAIVEIADALTTPHDAGP
jgi:photosystem II stability/assembly factor-like uncharacterized protein